MDNNEQIQDITQRLRNQIIILGLFVLIIWLIEIIDWILGGNLDQFGILPRQIIGLRGIITAPVLPMNYSLIRLV